MKPQINRELQQLVTIVCLSSMMFTQTEALSQQNVESFPRQLATVQVSQGKFVATTHRIQDTYFTYDLSGDISTKTVGGKKTTYTYNTINELITIHKPDSAVVNLANDYDALGNMKQDPNGNQYQYNVLGQLTQFQNRNTGVRANYQYYTNGLRAKKIITSNPIVEPIEYYYDDVQNANITNERQGQLTTSYLLPSGHMVRYIHDGQGNTKKQIAIHGAKDVEAIINDQAKMQKTYHYSPNGIIKPIIPQGQIDSITHPNAMDFSITENPFQYSGQYRDPESGLDYLRARYYNPKIQRFIQRDSYQLLNRYAYVNGNPIMGFDPSGHKTKQTNIWLQLAGAAATILLVWAGYRIGDKWIGASKSSGENQLSIGVDIYKDRDLLNAQQGQMKDKRIEYDDGTTYQGQTMNDKRHGYGAYKDRVGNIYYGKFEHDRLMDGPGEVVYNYRDETMRIYRGEFKDGELEGRVESERSGALYSGIFDEIGGFKDGPGTMKKNGEQHEGVFKDDSFITYEIIFPNGDIHQRLRGDSALKPKRLVKFSDGRKQQVGMYRNGRFERLYAVKTRI